MRSRNPTTRARHSQAELQRRATRAARRHMVPVSSRDLDDDIVDWVAIDLVLRGFRRYAVKLRRTELIAAIQEGNRRGLGVPQLADLLCLHERTAQRLKDEGHAEATEKRAA